MNALDWAKKNRHKDVIDYLELVIARVKVKLAKERPWSRSKLMIVGQGAAGKTSLFKALTSQPHERRHISTIGADSKDYETSTHNINNWAQTTKRDSTRTFHNQVLRETVLQNPEELSKRALFLVENRGAEFYDEAERMYLKALEIDDDCVNALSNYE